MLKKIICASAALFACALTTLPAQAGRVAVTDDLLARVESAPNGLDRLRVYPSRKLIVERSTDASSSFGVDGDVETVIRKKMLKETVRRGTPGKIIAIEGEQPWEKMLYVTWDPDCMAKDCAFGFAHQTKAKYHRFGGKTYWTSKYYHLTKIPEDPAYDSFVVYTRKGLIRSRLGYRRSFVLQIKKRELEKITREKRRHRGIE